MEAATVRPWDLAAAAFLVLAACLAALLDAPAWLRVPLGLAMVLAAPGYAFVAALYPERHHEATEASAEGARRGLSPLERAALSLGLSIAVVPLLGLALNYTALGIREGPVLLTIAAFTLACLAAAWARRRRLPEDERLLLRIHVDTPSWRERPPMDRALTVALAAAVVLAAGSLVYVLAVPRPVEALTAFYLHGPTGEAWCYPATFQDGAYLVTPADAAAGCPLRVANVTVGIVNHEGRTVDYWVRMVWTQETRLPDNSSRIDAIHPAGEARATLPHVDVDLALNARFRPQHEFAYALPPPPGNGTWRLSFQLFVAPPPPLDAASGLETPHQRLHLWIDA